MNLKRLFLFVILFSSGLFILFFFMEEDEPEVIPPPPSSFNEGNTGAPAGAPAGAPVGAPVGTDAGAMPEEGDLQIPSFEPPGNRDTDQANMQDATLTMMETLAKEDGTTEKVLAARFHVAFISRIRDSNELRANDVSFTFYDKTPRRRPVAEGTADHAVLVALGGGESSITDLEFGKDLVLKDNVRVKLLAENDKVGEKAAETILLAPLLFLEEKRIRAPLSEDGNDRVTILSSGIEIAGRGMEADLEKGSLSFQKEIRVEGTDFDMPALFPNPSAPTDGKECVSEPLVISCGGPFLFEGDRAEKIADSTADNNEANRDFGSLIKKGTLSFAGGVTVTCGGNSLEGDDMTMAIARNPKGELTLSSIKSGELKPGVSIDAMEGTTRCRTFEWLSGETGTLTRLLGKPMIEGLSLPTIPGLPDEGEGGLYNLSAGKEISIEATDAGEGREAGVIVHLLGGGSIFPAGAAGAGKPPLVAGKEIHIHLKPRERQEGATEEEGDVRKSTGFLPDLIRVTGNAAARLEDVLLEADEITMTLEPGATGLRRLTLSGEGVLHQGEYSLQSQDIVIRTVPGITRDGSDDKVDFTEILAGDGFVLTLSLDEFGQNGKTEGDARRERGEKKAGLITARGDGTVRMSWYDRESKEPSAEKIKPNMQIFGPYEIDVDLGKGDRVMIHGKEMLDMGTSTFEESLVTILALKGSPHIRMMQGKSEAMRLDCNEAWVTFDHTAAAEHAAATGKNKTPETERSAFGPTPGGDENTGFFTSNIVRRLEAKGEVDLCYGFTQVTCDSVDWRLPKDRLVADGGGKPVVIIWNMMKLSGSRFLLKPTSEYWEICDPAAFVLPRPGGTGAEKK